MSEWLCQRKALYSTIIRFLDLWTKILEKGGCVDVIYMDFAKKFDKVPHKRFHRKLQGLGITSKTITWIEHFSGRGGKKW